MDRDLYLTHKVDAPTPTRWYQFTVRRILGATSWVAAGCGAVVYFQHGNRPPSGVLGVLLVFGLLAIIFLAPFLAVGTLIGRPGKALLLGFVFLGFWLAVFLFSAWMFAGPH